MPVLPPRRQGSRRRLIRVLVIVALSSVTGCAGARRSSLPEEDDADVVTLNVINHHPLDVVVYNVGHGHRDRIGQVTAASTRSFQLHLSRFPGGELQFYADPVGSRESVTSELLHLFPGESASWTLETDLARSSITVRN